MQKRHLTNMRHPFLIQTLSQLENGGTYLKRAFIKKIKLYSNITINGKKKNKP